MAKLFDANGNEVEAFTPEELEAKKKEALDAYLKDHPDQSGDLKTAQDALKAAQDKLQELEGAGDKGKGQKDRLIKERDEALQKVSDLEKTMMTEINGLRDTFFGSAKTKVLDKLAGGDVELRKKIELEYDNFKGEPKTEVEIQDRLAKAYTLAKGVAPAPNFMDGAASGSDRGVDQNHGSKGQTTENAKKLQTAFGITDEQVQKFTPKTN